MRIFWTDGSAEPNPGQGGFAVIEEKDGVGQPVALGKEEYTTNIRMEGCALIAAMEKANGEVCKIYTDSEFWTNVLTKWAPGWKRNGWTKRNGEIKNLDLVQKMYKLYKEGSVDLIWVRGHNGTELNEMADEWANRAREGAQI